MILRGFLAVWYPPLVLCHVRQWGALTRSPERRHQIFSDELHGLRLQSGAEPPCHRVRNLTSWFYKREGVTTEWTGVFPKSHDI